MAEISASEAKTNLPRLLKRVQAGERFIITRHSHPVAELIPFRERDSGRIRDAINDLSVSEDAQPGRNLRAADDRRRASALMRFVLDCSVAMSWAWRGARSSANKRELSQRGTR